jgi:hypothetical protein
MRKNKKSISTRTTHKEELEYLGIVLVELMRFGAQGIQKFFRRGKNPQRLIYNWKRNKLKGDVRSYRGRERDAH